MFLKILIVNILMKRGNNLIMFRWKVSFGNLFRNIIYDYDLYTFRIQILEPPKILNVIRVLIAFVSNIIYIIFKSRGKDVFDAHVAISDELQFL